MDDYQKLTEAKSLGFYNCCEMTTAFLMMKKEKKIGHFFTIFVLEERVEVKPGKQNLSPQLIPVTKDISMGIMRRVMSVEDAWQCYQSLHTASGSDQSARTVDIGDGELQTGRLEEVPPIFVQKNSTKEIRLNEVLKNNFKNGSYVLEFFDVEKTVCKCLKKEEQNKACRILFEYVPVNLLTIRDRIGNFVFQFPSLNAQISYFPDEKETTLHYHVKLDPRLKDVSGYQLTSELSYDDVVIGFGSMEVQGTETEMALHVGDSSRICRTTLMDPKNQLILSRRDTSYMREMRLRMHIGSQFGEMREIYNKDGSIAAMIDVVSAETIRTGYENTQYREEWIKNRQYRLRMEELEKRQEFMRYGTGDGAGRERALNDLIRLMQRGDGHRVYLWDPYLSAQDLLDTWYHTTIYGMELRAITSRSDLDKEPSENPADDECDRKMEEWITQQRSILENGSNQYGINLELRCQWKQYGYPFHDRFLMIVDDREEPQVWSLGASINSVGKKHHIIQKVLDPQMIVDAFEELWDMLSGKECLVWKSGKQMH